jgi:hypothetical protein
VDAVPQQPENINILQTKEHGLGFGLKESLKNLQECVGFEVFTAVTTNSSYLTTDGQSVLVWGDQLVPATNFSYFFFFVEILGNPERYYN